MLKLDEELDDDFESDDEVPNEDDDEYEDDEEDPEEEPVGRSQQPSQVAALKSKLKEATDEIASLNKRLGNATEQLGKKLKEKDREVEGWLEKINPWHDKEVQEAKTEGFAEGQKVTEDRLLPRLLVEERAAYLEEARTKAPKISPHPVTPLDTRRPVTPSDANEDINDVVQEFVEQGVPLDQLDQTSAKTVVSSGTRWLKQNPAPEVEEASQIRKTREREENGSAKVSGGGTGSPRPTRATAQKRLDEINVSLRKMRGRGDQMGAATKLINERKQLEQLLKRRSAA